MSSRVKTRVGGQGKYSPEQVDAILKLIDELPLRDRPPMLEVFDRMVKEAREGQNEKTREWWAKRKNNDSVDPTA